MARYPWILPCSPLIIFPWCVPPVPSAPDLLSSVVNNFASFHRLPYCFFGEQRFCLSPCVWSIPRQVAANMGVAWQANSYGPVGAGVPAPRYTYLTNCRPGTAGLEDPLFIPYPFSAQFPFPPPLLRLLVLDL